MDAPNIETGEPAPCPVCGEAHPECGEALLTGMALTAWSEAERRLSEQGMEVLRMVDHAIDALGVEAWNLAENAERLPAHEIQVIEVYLARKTLIDVARKDLYESEE